MVGDNDPPEGLLFGVCRSLLINAQISLIEYALSNGKVSKMFTTDRPEIVAALNGVLGQSKRFSDSLGMAMVYVALPVFTLGGQEYVVRSSMSVEDIDQSVRRATTRIVLTGRRCSWRYRFFPLSVNVV